jgi:hypothetical protein
VKAIVRDIGGGAAGQAQMILRMVPQLKVPGEGWFAMLVRNPAREKEANGDRAEPQPASAPGEQWFTFSRYEIGATGGGGQGLTLTLPDGVKHTFDPGQDLLFRVWNPDKKIAHLPDSPVHHNFAALNEIVKSTATIDGASQSRLTGNGVLFLPQEASLPSQQAPAAVPIAGETPGPATVEPEPAQQLQDLLYEVASAAIKDPRSSAAQIPIIVTAPGDYIKQIQHIKFGSDVSETALKTRASGFERLARGLDVSPERLLGMAISSNHWGQESVGQDDIRSHIAPVLETICDALTREVLRAQLIGLGKDPDKYTIWYDTGPLSQDPDKKDEATAAHDRGALNNAALRDAMGFTDEDGYDLTTREGWLQFATDKISADPSLIQTFAPVLGKLVEGIIAPPTPAPALEPAPPAPPAEPVSQDESTTEPATGPQPPALPAAAAFSFSRICVARAMELANKRRRSRNTAFLENLPLDQSHIRLDPTNDAARLIEGWDSVLNDEDVEAFGLDRARLAELVLDVAHDALSKSSPWQITPARVRKASR